MTQALNTGITDKENKPQLIQQNNLSKKKEIEKEYRIVLLGTNHKQKLFEKVLSSACKYERHLQYRDIFYLYYAIDDENVVIQLNDPGLKHTGEREMAVRKADAVILCYSVNNAASFHKLAALASDFECHKNNQYFPIVLMANEDEDIISDEENNDYLNDDFESNYFTSDSLTSEGYCSLDEQQSSSPSLNLNESEYEANNANEKINNAFLDNEESYSITREQGENMAQLFNKNCQFISTSFSEYNDSLELITNMIKQIKTIPKNKKRIGKSFKGQKNPSKVSSSIHLPLRLNLLSNENEKIEKGFHISPIFLRRRAKVAAQKESSDSSLSNPSVAEEVDNNLCSDKEGSIKSETIKAEKGIKKKIHKQLTETQSFPSIPAISKLKKEFKKSESTHSITLQSVTQLPTNKENCGVDDNDSQILNDTAPETPNNKVQENYTNSEDNNVSFYKGILRRIKTPNVKKIAVAENCQMTPQRSYHQSHVCTIS